MDNISWNVFFCYRNFICVNGAVDGNWWDSEVKVGAAKENGSQEKGQLTITKMRSMEKQKKEPQKEKNQMKWIPGKGAINHYQDEISAEK